MGAIAADIHTFFAGLVTSTGRVGGRPAATEFVGGSMTSLGVPETLGFPPGDRSREAALLTERLETQNPHIKFNNQALEWPRFGGHALSCPDGL